MPDLLKRMGAPIIFAVLALAATIAMVADRNALTEGGRELSWWQAALLQVAVPVQNMVAVPVDGARDAWSQYVDLLEVRDDNGELRGRITSLEEENLQYREALVASGNLQRIAEMRSDFEVPMLPGEVVGLDVVPWFRSILIDRGATDGVAAGNPVITDEGVVGLVTATSGGAAKTMLVLDRQSAIDGIVQRSRARGVVRGQGSDELNFEFVVRGGDVRLGDVIITSGLGGVYPKGLRIGEVVAVPDPQGRVVQVAKLRAAVDFGRLEQVFVMLRRGPTTELLYGANEPVAPVPFEVVELLAATEAAAAQAAAEAAARAEAEAVAEAAAAKAARAAARAAARVAAAEAEAAAAVAAAEAATEANRMWAEETESSTPSGIASGSEFQPESQSEPQSDLEFESGFESEFEFGAGSESNTSETPASPPPS